jgi:hypothetical protein
MQRIGVLMPLDEDDPVAKPLFSAFTQALADLGLTVGRNLQIDLRWHGSDKNSIRALAQELVGLQPDIIVTTSTPATAAVQQETRTIPIVIAGVADPVTSGIVARLDRPSGNVTGFANYEATLAGKWLELLSEIAPGLKRAAIMFNPDMSTASALMPSFETAARSLKVVPIIAPVHSDAEIETAITLGIYSRPCIARQSYRRWPETTYRWARHLASRRHLCRSHSTRREAGRSPGSVSDKIRDGRQPQDRQGARPNGAAIDSPACDEVIE